MLNSVEGNSSATALSMPTVKSTVAGEARRSCPAGGSFAYTAQGVASAHATYSGCDLEMIDVCPGVSISYIRTVRSISAQVPLAKGKKHTTRTSIPRCGSGSVNGCVEKTEDMGTHRAGVGHDVGDVLWRVHRFGAICALVRKVLVIRHNEREALAVDDMPVKSIELTQSNSHQTYSYKAL